MAAPKGNKFAKDNQGGRPTAYRPEFAEQAKKLCQLGATDVELADFFDVEVRTIYRWRATEQEFCQATRIGKVEADERMERALFQRGIGYNCETRKVVTDYKGRETVTVSSQHVPGEVSAQFRWLMNRRPERWRDKVDISHEVKPQRTLEEVRAEIVQRMIGWGVKLAPLTPMIEGNTEDD